MAKGRVLIIEYEQSDAAKLRTFLSEAGYEVHLATEARVGFDMVREVRPDCILCDVNLPDIDGFWVAQRVRAEPAPVALTPFLFLAEADTEAKLQGLNVGADLFLTKPFHSEEVVAQVGALIDMAKRLGRASSEPPQQDDEEPLSSNAGVAFHGDLAQMSFAAVLTLLELERRTGRLKLRSEESKVAIIYIIDGEYAGGTLDSEALPATDILRELMRWKHGTFSFRTENVEAISERHKLGPLLIEATRLEDESHR